jgi:hypothetical protein
MWEAQLVLLRKKKSRWVIYLLGDEGPTQQAPRERPSRPGAEAS